MGVACCTRDNSLKLELYNSLLYSNTDNKNQNNSTFNNINLNNGRDTINVPELRYEIVKLLKTNDEKEIENTILNLQNAFKNKIKKITYIELYNIALYFRDNNNENNPYLIYDMRKSTEQKEDYIKKMRHINYTYNQIQNLHDQKMYNFRKFLDNKIIIFIISHSFLVTPKILSKNHNKQPVKCNMENMNISKNNSNIIISNINKNNINNNNSIINNNSNIIFSHNIKLNSSINDINDINNINNISNSINNRINKAKSININNSNKQKKDNEGDNTNNDIRKCVNESPFEIISLLNSIQSNIKFYILNNTLNSKEFSPVFVKLNDFLNSNHSDILPYILFAHRHLTNFYLDGFFFIHFNANVNIFSFDNLLKAIKLKNEQPSHENIFLRHMNITTIIVFDCDNNSLNDNKAINPNGIKLLSESSHNFKNLLFKEFYMTWDDVLNSQGKILSICDWLKDEMTKGHSVYFNIINSNDYDFCWIMFIVIILRIITSVDVNEIIKYFKYKICFIDQFYNNINAYIKGNKNEINDILNDYGISQKFDNNSNINFNI